MNTQEAIEQVEQQAVNTSACYATLKPADAVAHLNERLAAECDCFERDTGLKLATIKVVRDRKAGDIFVGLQAHVR